MAKSINKKDLKDIVEMCKGNIHLIGKALDKQFPILSNDLDDKGEPKLKPRTYSSVYMLIKRHNLQMERIRADTDLDAEIQSIAKIKLLQAVASGQRWAIERIAVSKLGFGNKETLDQKIEVSVTKSTINHAHRGVIEHKHGEKPKEGEPDPNLDKYDQLERDISNGFDY